MSRRNSRNRRDENTNSNRFQFDLLQQFFSCFRESSDGAEERNNDSSERLSGLQNRSHGRGLKQNQKRRNQRRILINRSMIGYPMDFRHTGHLGSDDLPFNLSNIESVINDEDALRLQIQMKHF